MSDQNIHVTNTQQSASQFWQQQARILEAERDDARAVARKMKRQRDEARDQVKRISRTCRRTLDIAWSLWDQKMAQRAKGES